MFGNHVTAFVLRVAASACDAPIRRWRSFWSFGVPGLPPPHAARRDLVLAANEAEAADV